MSILVVGDANADVSATLERFPREGEDCRLRGLGWSSGGSAANVAAALAILGARARLLARVGTDPAADVALAAARRAGVNLGAIQRDPALPTGLCFAAVSPGGERTFFSFRGANVALDPAPGLLDGASLLHVGGHALLEGRQRATTLALIDEASRRGIPIALDLCLPLLEAAPGDVAAIAPRLAILLANEPELAALARSLGAPPERDPLGAVHAELDRPGGPIVVAKLGARGAAVGGPERLAIPAFPIDARDTTGAGDAFAAGFLLAHLRGATPAVAARLGNALGALTATRPGAADALPTLPELRAFLASQGAARELAVLAKGAA